MFDIDEVQNLAEWQKRWMDPTETEMKDRFDWFNGFNSSKNDHKIGYELIYERLRGVRDMVKKYINLALPFEDDLSMTSMVGGAFDLGYLLTLYSPRKFINHGPLAKQQRFEVLRMFDLTRLAFEEDKLLSQQSHDEYLSSIVHLIQVGLFCGSKRIEAFSYHDAKRGYLVEKISLERRLEISELFERSSLLTCRLFQGRNKLVYPVLFHDRNKPVEEAVLKRIKQRANGRCGEIEDRSGIMMVFETIEIMDEIIRSLQSKLEHCGVKLDFVSGNLRQDGVKDCNNPHSSNVYRAEEYKIRFTGHANVSHVCELQGLLFDGYYNGRYSLTRANHALYRLRQSLDFYFPFLFPEEVYGIDWSSENVRNLLFDHTVASLGLGLHNGNRVNW